LGIDFNENMKAQIQRIIEKLKRRVKENLEIINQNQSKISELLKQPFSSERTYHIDKIYAVNKALLNENNDFINLQLTLLNFIEKYKSTMVMEDDDDFVDFNPIALLDDNELFELTVQGKLNYECGHPKFEDNDFFNRLLDYYATLEAYEKCNFLLGLKKKKQVG
jgi:hypothetical protein